jgi:hypothetical protein
VLRQSTLLNHGIQGIWLDFCAAAMRSNRYVPDATAMFTTVNCMACRALTVEKETVGADNFDEARKGAF